MSNEHSLYAIYEIARDKRQRRIHHLTKQGLEANEIMEDPEYQRLDRKYKKAYREWGNYWKKWGKE